MGDCFALLRFSFHYYGEYIMERHYNNLVGQVNHATGSSDTNLVIKNPDRTFSIVLKDFEYFMCCFSLLTNVQLYQSQYFFIFFKEEF